MEGSTTRSRGSGSASGSGAGSSASGNGNAATKSAKPSVGSRIEVYWDNEGKYYAGVVKSFHRSTGKYLVKYDDGDEERLNFNKEQWRPEEVQVGDDDDEDDEDDGESAQTTPEVGMMIEVFWESEGAFFKGKVAEMDAAKNKCKVEYVDGDVERLVLSKERWRLVEPQPDAQDSEPLVGSKIEVLWPDDKKFYRGEVRKFDRRTGKHLIRYEDGDEERLTLANEQWRYVSTSRQSKNSSKSGSSSSVATKSKSAAVENSKQNGSASHTSKSRSKRTASDENLEPENDATPKVGDAIEVYWPDDQVHYPGKVAEYNTTSKKFKIVYDDGDIEHLNLDNEKWRFANQRKRRRGGVPTGAKK